MDKIIKARKPVRSSFTKTYNTFKNEVDKENPDASILKLHVTKLERFATQLGEMDEKLLDLLLSATEEDNEKQYETEYEAIETYRSKLDDVRVKYEQYVKSGIDGNSVCESQANSFVQRKKIKLPKIELVKFSGEVNEWLSFWSQFKRIHNDSEIEKEDKFQYLLQTVVFGTRAFDVVHSYPPTAENYDKVIDSLKTRFGREELLIEYYVRELLGLVVQNVSSHKTKLSLSRLYDSLESFLRALESIGVTSDKYAAMLFPLVESCLPEELLRVWLRHTANIALSEDEDNTYSDKLNQLLTFVKTEVEGEERITLAQAGFKVTSSARHNMVKKNYVEERVPTASNLFTSSTRNVNSYCVFCNESHLAQNCYKARDMTLQEKKRLLMGKQCCFLCLKAKHNAKFCSLRVKCLECKGNHYAVMCSQGEVKMRNSTSTTLTNQNFSHECLLQTLKVKLVRNGCEKVVRALVDNGSQRSYILKKTADSMGYKAVSQETLIHVVFGGLETKREVHPKYNIVVCNLKDGSSCQFDVLARPTICGSVPRIRSGPWLKEMKEKGIWLSDVGNGEPEIELLLGADVAHKLLMNGVHKLNSGLVAVETTLGWVIMGKTPKKKAEGVTACIVTSMLTINKSVTELWRLDTLGIKDPTEEKSQKELEESALEHFKNTVKVNEEGRYEVKLPWIENHAKIKDNSELAKDRCINTTKQLVRTGKFEEYDAVFKEWSAEGIIEEVPMGGQLQCSHYLPHRAVYKENSTTKIRPVFDASCHARDLPSLNDCLVKGPNLIELIPSVLLRFREKKIGIVSDIKKAFLQISVNEKDCDYLRFWWWENLPEGKMKIFRHRRVVFGLNCSPFLLEAVLQHHLSNVLPCFTPIAEKLKQSFYVDNCVTSVDSQEEVSEFIETSVKLLSEVKFDLRGWEYTMKNEDYVDEESTSVLGLFWNKSSDMLFVDVRKLEDVSETISRRIILSTTHRVFDPIGFLAPVMLCPKLLLQESWHKKMNWDEPVSPEIKNKFEKWFKHIVLLEKIKIPRCFSIDSTRATWTLHVFCDASRLAYATVIFLRSESKGEVNVQLLASKARVAPLKNVSIPRLELLACCIGARLASTVMNGLKMKSSVFYWSDSTTALCWIKGNETWATFVQNRVMEIRSLSEIRNWRYVPTEKNPADLPSRGCSIPTLLKSAWWEGPDWLRQREDQWPTEERTPNEEVVNSERRKTVVTMVTVEESSWYMTYFSTYKKILRMITWICRFVNNCRLPRRDRVTEELSVQELDKAEKILWHIVQTESFRNDDSRLKSLVTFKDENGIIRIKTKILNREEQDDFRCPIVLPSDHEMVHKLIREGHVNMSHAGVQILLTELRRKYWILRGRRTIRSVVTKCVRCRRYKAKNMTVVPTTLPEDRVRDALVFEITGVDLTGPLVLKNGSKAWIVLFTCAVFRAVHLELVTSLSTVTFLLALRRFVARRGKPSIIYSDNGSNFVGAVNLFRNVDWKEVMTDAAGKRITWKFIPPSAAWWGGWWERIIRMVKTLLRSVLGRTSLDYEEMATILCDCEAVINSRPLTYLSEDAEDLCPLTPAMFIQDNQEVGTPVLDEVDRTHLTNRWKKMQQLREHLRIRFRSEYLAQLVQKKNDARRECREIKVDEVVLVGSDNKRRIQWPMGRVIDIFPGKDKVVRVAKVKTENGVLIRPIQRLFPLEVSIPEAKEMEKSRDNETADDDDKNKTVVTRSGREVKIPIRYLL